MKRLTRSPADGKIAGVCAGIAQYLDVDVTFVRAAWIALSIVPGAIIGGLIAYLLVWMVMPEGPPAVVDPTRRRLTRSASNVKVAGVCGGIAEYFDVDATPIRVLWILLSVVPGCFIGGIVAYLVAWIVMPNGPTAPAVIVTPAASA